MSQVATADPIIATLAALMILTALHIEVGFFVVSTAQILTLDLVTRFMLPPLDPGEQRLASRTVVALLFAVAAMLASAAPLPTMLVGSVVLSLSVQLLPAYLDLCWLPWISCSAVLAGPIMAIPIVIFTEPPGLVLFEGLFLDLPWRCWPLTIHAALGGSPLTSRPACLSRSSRAAARSERIATSCTAPSPAISR